MDEPGGAYPTNFESSIPARRTQPEDRGRCGDHFSAPLGSSKNGRLRFMNGAHRIAIGADLHLRGLYRARFGDRMPAIRVQGGVVIIRFPRVPACDWVKCGPERPAEVELSARIPWDLEVRGGASWLVADLRGLRLGSLKVDGGANRLEVTLPAPSGTVALAILGGASNVAIRRPEGVAARLCVSGGATNLKLDHRRVGAAGGELDLRDGGYDGATDRYEVVITGGANNMIIDEQRVSKEGADLDLESE
jgi:hypothetical protein